MAEGKPRLVILVLGGYGVFGSRLVRLLAEDERLSVIVAGRSLDKAAAFRATLPADAQPRIRALRLERDGDVAGELRAASPDILVDASGPFQAYGEDPYRVAKTAIALRIAYLDLADGADFVTGIAALDAAARQSGVFVLAGVSTCPALTAAVVRRLAQGMARLDRVRAGIAPSPHARVGLNVLRAVASYAGRKITARRNGTTATAFGLTETLRRTIAPPGHLPLESRLFSLVDVPDLRLLPLLWPDLREVWFGMGPVPAFLHRIFIGLARLARHGLLPGLAPFASAMHGVAERLRFGPHRGGMLVELEGADAQGRVVKRCWHMLAEGDDGPFIPSMAAAAIIRRCLDGRRPEPGARDASRALELADYAPFFAARAIVHGIRDEGAADGGTPLYRRLLGESFERLPAPLRAMHDVAPDTTMSAAGEAEVERGTSLLARLACALLGLPRSGRHVPLRVTFAAKDGRETWRRDFAGRIFATVQEAGQGRSAHLLHEWIGPFGFDLALVASDGRLTLVPRGWSLLGIPLPRALAPRSAAHESVADGRFAFHVEIAMPVIGRLIRYRGWLMPERR